MHLVISSSRDILISADPQILEDTSTIEAVKQDHCLYVNNIYIIVIYLLLYTY